MEARSAAGIPSSELQAEWVAGARHLHVDGHDFAAATQAARWARAVGIPVLADLDNRYPGVEDLLENVDYAITSREFRSGLPANLTYLFHCRTWLRALDAGSRPTLGTEGVLAWDRSRFHYSPAFEIKPVDTTGAGDVFHGAFAFARLQGAELPRALEFSCAAAGLSCLGKGARGGIESLEEIEALVRMGDGGPRLLHRNSSKLVGRPDDPAAGGHSAGTRFATLNALLILVNVLAFLYELSLSPRMGHALVYSFGLIPAHEQLLFARHGISLPQAIVPIFASMFLHGGWLHLLGTCCFCGCSAGRSRRRWGTFSTSSSIWSAGGVGSRAYGFQSWVEGADDWGERGDFGSDGGFYCALSEVARDDADSGAIAIFYRADSRVSDAGVWFFLQFFSGVTSLGMTDQGEWLGGRMWGDLSLGRCW